MTKQVLLACLFPVLLHAQDLAVPNAPAPGATAPPGATAVNPPDTGLVIESATCSEGTKTRECELGDTITLRFKNLTAWCNSPDHDPGALSLILDGRLMAGVHPVAPMPCDNELRFELKRLEDDQDASKQNRAAWAGLLRRVRHDTRTVRLNVGSEAAGNARPVCFSGTTFTLRVFPAYTWVVYVFLGALFFFFLLLAGRSDILRDPGPDPPEDKDHPSSAPTGVARFFCGTAHPRRTFSLARCQMAWWFFVVMGGYNYIWLVTGDRNSLTPGVLILIGISAATGLGSLVIDNGRTGAPRPTRGLLLDILQEDNSVSFHRFQMAVWTMVLGFVFAVAVYRDLSMPDFSVTLLGLMGISSGTYIGFKIPDPKPAGAGPAVS